MSGPGSIEYLKETISAGLAKPNRYIVEITFPFLDAKQSQSTIAPFIKSAISIKNSTISVLCESVELPGLHYATVEDRLWGPVRKIPYLPIYNDVSMVFMCDANMEIRYLFDQWQTMIAAKNFKFETYYDEFVSRLSITLLNDKNRGENVYSVICHEAYPIEIVSQQCSYTEVDNYLKMEVKMAYRYFDFSDTIPNLRDIINLPPGMDRSDIITI